jgi:histidyl-tRNA synthetase
LIKTPRGTQDILPDDWPIWNHVLDCARQTAEGSGYERIETPTFESTSLFAHAAGEFTDVRREMYTFEDRGGDELSLRPEGTASVFRAYFQHGMHVLPQPVKLYYIGSMFRYERPQGGRAREHHQFGCEAIGSEDALLDASMLDLQQRFYRSAGIEGMSIHVNSIGDQNCRPAYIRELVAYLQAHKNELCHQCRERIERNPLRVLDCKVESCQPVLNNAPKTIDHLCTECRTHWERFLQGLEALGIQATIDPRLVRGLDYYSRTVWEILPARVASAQSTIGGGGRYDALAGAIGAPAAPGVGFSTGLERVILNLSPEVARALQEFHIDVFVAHRGSEAETQALRLTHRLQEAGLRTDMSFDDRSLKTQLKHANNKGARVAVIIGEEEIEAGEATVRDFKTGKSKRVTFESVLPDVRSTLEQQQLERL